MAVRRTPVLLGRGEERQLLDRLLEDARGGRSAVLVLRGEPGIGKTALLHYCARQASGFRVARLVGVESEMELPFAGLHQLCTPLMAWFGALPAPQQAALEVALGLSSGPTPNRFLVALAALSLLSEAASERPLLCLVDDAHWLDVASSQVLGFVGRRLRAESVALVFAVRDTVVVPEFVGLPLFELTGLNDDDTCVLLATVLPGRLDVAVRDRLVAETHGNPLAILELPRELTATHVPGVFGVGPVADGLPGRLEESFLRRLDAVPEEARLLLLVAAAEPIDDPVLVWRAAALLGVTQSAAAHTDELLAVSPRMTFPHPLVRSAVYRSASAPQRRAVHRALANATTTAADADRRAWHLAASVTAPDEHIASELQRCAGRAQARGGLAAAAAFLERAATLSPEPAVRAMRTLAAVGAKRDAGALEAATKLLDTIDVDALDETRQAKVDVLRGEIAFDQARVDDATPLLAAAARRLVPVDVTAARRTYVEALGAAMWQGERDGPRGMRTIAEAARLVPNPPDPPTASDALLDALTLLLTDGHAAAAPSLRTAFALVLAPHPTTDDHDHWLWFAVAGNAITIAQELWDADSWRALAVRHERFSRHTGALVQLQYALNMLAWIHILAGEVSNATQVLDEQQIIAEATGNRPINYSEAVVAAWRGQEQVATERIEAMLQQAPPGGRVACYANYARAVLYNGLGRHAEAANAARSAFEPDHLGYGPFVVPELAEAAARTGDVALLATALDWMTERTRVTGTEWSLATEARVRALASTGTGADSAYQEAIDRLSPSWLRPELGRVHLLYGEWLRRDGRRTDARDQLRTAHDTLTASGMDAFAERARRELAATGMRVRKRTVETYDELTPQERQVAHLARAGLTNAEIGARLFLSPRTVEWHMRKVFIKLAITSRQELRDALPTSGHESEPS